MSGKVAVAAVALGAAVAATFVSPVSPAWARITEIRIGTIEPFAEGQPFGEAGSYERVTGTAKGELDPQSAQNHDIADLDKAPRNARGLVEYETDFFMLRPLEPARGNGVIFYEVNNRGRKALLTRVDEAPANNNDPRTILDAGFGFTLGRGYTIVWSGWDPDAPRANNGLAARLPVATDNGKPIVRRIREEFAFGTRNNASADIAKLSYPAASLDSSAARLTVREREGDPRVDIPSTAWSFASNRTLHLVPAGRKFAPPGTTPPRRRWWAWGSPRPAISCRFCVTSASTPREASIRRWAATPTARGPTTRSYSASPRAAASSALS
jgi:hypothetical protein